ncbi:MAG: EAL domain-containing protein [Actinomycetota bacterium]|nr:EAL domain-containing protein [Actinomycetota bacterium]
MTLRRPGRVGAVGVIMALLAVAIGLALIGADLSSGVRLDQITIPLWLLLATFVAAELVVLHVQVNRQAKVISLNEIPLVLGLFFASTTVLVTACVVSLMLVVVVHRRQRSALKLAFNTAMAVTSVVAALAAFNLVLGDERTVGRTAWAATYAAVAAFMFVSNLSVGLVVGCFDGLRLRSLLHDAVSGVGLALCVGTLALVAVTSLVENPESGILLAASAVVILSGYRAYARLRERHTSLERLYRFSEVVAREPDLDEVLRSVLEEARDMLRAERAEITLLGDITSADGMRLGVDANGVMQRDRVVVQTDDALASVVYDGRTILAPRRTRNPVLRHYLGSRHQTDAIVVPVRGPSGMAGAVSVADRKGEVRTFDAADVQLLETLANHAAVALQNGRLIDQLRHDSLHDALTGLPNRVLLMTRMREALMSIASGECAGVATLLMDLDGFKEVNDTLGHQHGDELLIEVAARLSATAGAHATVARLGGDEFAVLVPDVADNATAVAAARHLLDALRPPFLLSDLEIEVSASIGVAVAPDHATDVSTLLKRADVAMYSAKSSGAGARIYDPHVDHHAPERLTFLTELRQAVHLEQLVIHVQPKADLDSRVVTSVEALVRWDHPEKGIVLPSVFIPTAERSGLIMPLTLSVLRAALGACAGWRDAGREIGVAVNLSPRTLLEPHLVDLASDLLHEYGVPSHLLTLEITESSVMIEPDRAIRVLSRLRAMGVQLSVDDFGTGYSSLSYLQRLPVHEVKIDRSFVTDMCRRPDDAAIVRSIIDLGDNLSLGVVAEGVEDGETWARLSEMGCRSAQGYHLARPLPVDALLPWLADHETAPAPA